MKEKKKRAVRSLALRMLLVVDTMHWYWATWGAEPRGWTSAPESRIWVLLTDEDKGQEHRQQVGSERVVQMVYQILAR